MFFGQIEDSLVATARRFQPVNSSRGLQDGQSHTHGALVSDQKAFGFDVIMPAFFIVMLVPLWRGARRAIPWAVAGGVALLVATFVPGWWFIIAGSLAGGIAGGFVDER